MQRVAHDSKTISTATKYNCMSQHLPEKTFVEEAFHDIFALWGVTLRGEKLKHPSGHHKQPKENERRERSLSMSRPDDCASEGTAAFGVSSAAGAAVAELAPL
jgi:hypothetical protein